MTYVPGLSELESVVRETIDRLEDGAKEVADRVLPGKSSSDDDDSDDDDE